MYLALQHRYQLVLSDCVDLLADAMGPSPFTSSASSPSLRSRTSVTVATPPPDMMAPGGNVKVVVRVRDFLPRGEGCTDGKHAHEANVWQKETEAQSV